MKKFIPIGDKVLIRTFYDESETMTKLLQTDEMKKKNIRGEVLEVGTGSERPDGTITPLPFKKGDIIVFYESAGMTINLDREEYKVISMRDVIGIIESEPNE